jgi:hypothetical protein
MELFKLLSNLGKGIASYEMDISLQELVIGIIENPKRLERCPETLERK